MPSPGCCCCDETKASLGLPDTITDTFSNVTGGSVGMPADSVIGTCGTNDIHADWSQSEAIIDLLSSLDFEFISGPTANCCFLYRTAGTDEPCPGDEAAFTLLGASPFKLIVDADSFLEWEWSGNVSTDPDPIDPEDCCPTPSTVECATTCPWTWGWDNGTAWLPEDAYVSGEMRICVNGTIVAITITLSIVCTYTAIASLGEIIVSESYIDPVPTCDRIARSISGTTTSEGCTSISGTITLSATQDLSGVSGATIWDKIKAATWTFDYEYGICGVGGGCAGAWALDTADCDVLASCYCYQQNPTHTEEESHPVDQDCLYSAGTVDVAFS